MTTFHRLDGKPLHLQLVGNQIDTVSISAVFDALQSVTDALVARRLNPPSAQKQMPFPKQYKLDKTTKFPPGSVRLMITNATVGSFSCVLDYYIAAALADPSINAILLNLTSDLIFAFASSGVRGVAARIHPSHILANQALQAQQDPYNIAKTTSQMMATFAADDSIEKMRLKVNSAGEVDFELKRSKTRLRKG
jgi:hypothetical protein